MITNFEKEFYKNWYDIKYLKKNASNNTITIVNRIKKTSDDGPFIDNDIAELVYERVKDYKYSKEDIHGHIETAIRNIRKGNKENIFEILYKKLNQ